MDSFKKFDIDKAILSLRKAIQPLPKAALFELYDQGFTPPFDQLLACLISVRTYDEVTVPVAQKLFTLGRTPEALSQYNASQILEAIKGCTFAETKARQMIDIAQTVMQKYQGQLPCDFDTLTSFKGIGPKCANLALGIACNQPFIGVDIHVHRITNRWGYVQTTTPEKTLIALEEKLPKKYWVEINRLLVPFGKHICTGNLPHCSTCPLLSMCSQVGVTKHR
jgi:endonuclease III